jgi:hypothetical protein
VEAVYCRALLKVGASYAVTAIKAIQCIAMTQHGDESLHHHTSDTSGQDLNNADGMHECCAQHLWLDAHARARTRLEADVLLAQVQGKNTTFSGRFFSALSSLTHCMMPRLRSNEPPPSMQASGDILS